MKLINYIGLVGFFLTMLLLWHIMKRGEWWMFMGYGIGILLIQWKMKTHLGIFPRMTFKR